jgi:arylsulfatase
LKEKEQLLKRRDALKAIGAGVCVSFCSPLSGIDIKGKRPNIVLCMADDQGWGDMAYYDHPKLKTPNFDKMADEGLRFDRFYAAAPVCSPTRGSVLTGRNPNRFGCFKWGHSLRPQEITIAEACKEAGYVTGHFGKWHLGSVLKGSPVNPGATGFDEWFSAPNFFDNDPILSREGKAVQTEGESSMVTVDAALEFMRKHQNNSDKPFLAVVWFGSPHNPHQAAEEDQDLYRDEEEKFKHFYGEITGMDRAFGKLRGRIDEMGIRDDTILWYCSDNGGLPELSKTGGRDFKGKIYEGGLRVPAILEWPEYIKSPRKTTVPCVTSDIYPTLLDILGIQMPGQPAVDGTSLLPVIRGKNASRTQPIGFWNRPEGGIITPSKAWMESLLKAQEKGHDVDDKNKLRLDAGDIKIQYPLDSFPGHSAWLDWPRKLHRIQDETGNVTFELYNLESDPMEASDLSGKETVKTAAMKAGLEEWLKSVVNSLNGEDY